MSKKSEKEIEKEIAALKAEHKQIYCLDIYIDGEESNENALRTLILKKPAPKQREAAEGLAAKKPYEGVKAFLRCMHVGGDDLEEVIANDEAFRACVEPLVEIVQAKTGNLRKV